MGRPPRPGLTSRPCAQVHPRPCLSVTTPHRWLPARHMLSSALCKPPRPCCADNESPWGSPSLSSGGPGSSPHHPPHPSPPGARVRASRRNEQPQQPPHLRAPGGGKAGGGAWPPHGPHFRIALAGASVTPLIPLQPGHHTPRRLPPWVWPWLEGAALPPRAARTPGLVHVHCRGPNPWPQVGTALQGPTGQLRPLGRRAQHGLSLCPAPPQTPCHQLP